MREQGGRPEDVPEDEEIEVELSLEEAQKAIEERRKANSAAAADKIAPPSGEASDDEADTGKPRGMGYSAYKGDQDDDEEEGEPKKADKRKRSGSRSRSSSPSATKRAKA